MGLGTTACLFCPTSGRGLRGVSEPAADAVPPTGMEGGSKVYISARCLIRQASREEGVAQRAAEIETVDEI